MDVVEAKPQRKRLTAIEKRERTAVQWARFIKLAGRKAQRRTEPNDRKYSKKRKAPCVECRLRTSIG